MAKKLPHISRKVADVADLKGLVTSAFNIAAECSDVITKYLLISNAPSVDREDPQAKVGMRNNLRGYGYRQLLRDPLESIVKRSKQPPIGFLSYLRPYVYKDDLEFIHKWDGYSETAAELAINVLDDLWNVVRRCEGDFGAIEAWGDPWLGDGRLHDYIREEWRFRDIPISLVGSRMQKEFHAWRNTEHPDDNVSAVSDRSKGGGTPSAGSAAVMQTVPPKAKVLVSRVITHLKAMQSDNNNQQPVGVSANQIATQLECSVHTVLKAMREIGWKVVSPKAEKATTVRRRIIGGKAGQIAIENVPSPANIPEHITEDEAKAKISQLPLKKVERDAILKQLVDGETTPTTAVDLSEALSEGRARTPRGRAHGKTTQN